MNKNKKYFLIYVVNILLGLLYISPLIWMVVSAFKPENRIFADMSKGLAAFWPAGATLGNFKEVFVRSNMPRYILNSVTYVTILVFLSMAVNSAFGYALAKFEFKGKNVILTVVLSLLVLPLESILLSLFFIVNKLGWVDSYLALIIPFIVKCFDVYLFRQFFLDVPDDLKYIVTDVSIMRFNRIGSEGLSSHHTGIQACFCYCLYSGLCGLLVRLYVAAACYH